MPIAKIRIKTAAGLIMPGEPVKGLSKEDVKEFTALGYIEDDNQNAETAGKAKAKAAAPKAAKKKEEEKKPEEADADTDKSGGDGLNLPEGVNTELT